MFFCAAAQTPPNLLLRLSLPDLAPAGVLNVAVATSPPLSSPATRPRVKLSPSADPIPGMDQQKWVPTVFGRGQPHEELLHSYAAMPAFEGHSPLELRWKHYAATKYAEGVARDVEESPAARGAGGLDALPPVGGVPCALFVVDDDTIGVRLARRSAVSRGKCRASPCPPRRCVQLLTRVHTAAANADAGRPPVSLAPQAKSVHALYSSFLDSSDGSSTGLSMSSLLSLVSGVLRQVRSDVRWRCGWDGAIMWHRLCVQVHPLLEFEDGTAAYVANVCQEVATALVWKGVGACEKLRSLSSPPPSSPRPPPGPRARDDRNHASATHVALLAAAFRENPRGFSWSSLIVSVLQKEIGKHAHSEAAKATSRTALPVRADSTFFLDLDSRCKLLVRGLWCWRAEESRA